MVGFANKIPLKKIRKTRLKMVRTSLSQNNANTNNSNNNNSVTLTVKDSVITEAAVNGKGTKPSFNGPTNNVATKNHPPSSSSSYINGTQHHKEVGFQMSTKQI